MPLFPKNLRVLCFPLFVACLLTGCEPVVTAPESNQRILFRNSYEIYVQGNKVGYLTADAVKDRDSGTLTFDLVEHMEVARAGEVTRTHHVIHSTEHPDDGLQSFTVQIQDGQQTQWVEGVVRQEMLHITQGSNERKRTHSRTWERGLRGPLALDWSLLDEPLEPGDQRRGKAFDPALLSTYEFSITAKEVVKYQDADALRCRLRLITGEIPLDATCWIQNGVMVEIEYDLMGLSMKRVSRSRALTQNFVTDFHLDAAVAIAVNQRLDLSRPTQKYRIVFPDAIAKNLNLATLLPESAYQQVIRVEPSAVVFQVRDQAAASGKVDEPIPEHLQASALIQSTATELTDVVAGLNQTTDDLAAAKTATEFVFEHVQEKAYDSGLASAVMTFQMRSGDCTEHACLLAALCRARKIPTRIAVGLIYLPQGETGKFWFHMWNECWIGEQWVALDATRPGQLGRQSTYIKLTDSALSDSQQSSFTRSLIPLLHAPQIQILD